jgi:hypothetical protein
MKEVTMQCQWSAVDAERYCTDTMAVRLRAQYEAHLAECQECMTRRDAAEHLENALLAAFPEVPVPVGSTERMLAYLSNREPAASHVAGRYWQVGLAAAATLVLLVAAAIVGPNQAVASVRHFLSFVPGIGLQSTTDETLLLAQPVSVTRLGETIRVNGVLATSSGTIVSYEIQGLLGGKSLGAVAGLDHAYLRDAAGHHYQLENNSVGLGGSSTENHATGIFGFAPVPNTTSSVTLVIPDSAGDWNLPLTLHHAQG